LMRVPAILRRNANGMERNTGIANPIILKIVSVNTEENFLKNYFYFLVWYQTHI